MKRMYLSPPHLGADEFELVKEAFASNWIAPLGPHVDAFEREFANVVGVSHAAALSSGTAALHLALQLIDVGPGDLVLCPTLTFCATANPIVYQERVPCRRSRVGRRASKTFVPTQSVGTREYTTRSASIFAASRLLPPSPLRYNHNLSRPRPALPSLRTKLPWQP